MGAPAITRLSGELPRAIEADEIVVVHRLLSADDLELASLHASLTEAERARAARFVFEIDRRRSIVSRGALRALLGRVLGLAPASLELGDGAHGKPSLTHAPELCFNVSHAPDHLYIAIAQGRDLGVDVEGGARPLEVHELARIVFTEIERAELAAYPVDEQRAAFLRGWTRKEAYLKARAVGLSLPLQDFSVSLGAELEVSLQSVVDPVEAERFSLVDLPAPDGYQAALAWARAGGVVRRVRLFSLSR